MNKLIISAFATIILWAWALSAHAQTIAVEPQPTVEVFNTAGKQDDSNWKNKAIRALFYDNLKTNWLCVARLDSTPLALKGFNPNYTYVSTRFKPVITEYPNHLWVITFESATGEKF